MDEEWSASQSGHSAPGEDVCGSHMIDWIGYRASLKCRKNKNLKIHTQTRADIFIATHM
jgi:hypothetical protein